MAFITASAMELTRTEKINDLVNYLAGDIDEDEKPPPCALPMPLPARGP